MNEEQKKKHTTSPNDLLREKLIVFQREIAALKRAEREQEEKFLHREQDFLTGLFEIGRASCRERVFVGV